MTSNNGDAKHLLNYHDAVVYPSDLAQLDSPTAWLNDACINFRMARLQRRTRGGAADDDDDDPDKREGGGKRRREGPDRDDGGARIDRPEDLFLDPSVVSFLMHQLTEDDEDYADELSNLSASWNLPPLPSGRCVGMKELEKEALEDQSDKTKNNGTSAVTARTRRRRRKRVFVPISDQFGASRATFARPGGGNHWSLLLWEIHAWGHEGRDGRTVDADALVGVGFHHFDSSRGFNARAARAVAKKLRSVLCASASTNDSSGDAIDVEECICPQQQNGHDCGVFALGFAEALCAAEDCGFSREGHERLLRTSFEEKGGQGGFASGLRKQIGDDIRELAANSLASM